MIVDPIAVTHRCVTIDRELCGSCGSCVALCPQNALFLVNAYLHIDTAKCTACGRCVCACPMQALSILQPSEVQLG